MVPAEPRSSGTSSTNGKHPCSYTAIVIIGMIGGDQS